jgi:hypothetical protein
MIGDWKNSCLCLEDGIKPAAANLIDPQNIYSNCLEGERLIDENATFEQFGYKSTELSYGSVKKIVAVCDKCKKTRTLAKQSYRNLCISCSKMGVKHKYPPTEEHRRNLSKAHIGKIITEEQRRKISASLKGRVPWNKGKPCSDEVRARLLLANKGRAPWNKGKKGLQVSYTKGKRLSKEHVLHLIENHADLSGEKNPLWGRKGIKSHIWKGGKKVTMAKCKAERRRELSFVPLNDCDVDGWIGHHLDKEYVLFIPKEIHESIRHRQSNQESMDRINEKVIDWYIDYYGLI